MAFQTTVPQQPDIGTPGVISDTSFMLDSITAFAEVDSTAGAPLEDPIPGILPGQLVVVGSEFDAGRLPHRLAADVDAVLVTGASSLALQTLGPVDFDGVVGSTRWALPTIVSFTFSNSADWLATNATLNGIDSTGALVSETIAIPAGGNATVNSTGTYVQVTEIVIPIQGGATGTFTVGVTAAAVLTKAVIHGVAMNAQHREGTADLNGVASGPDGLPYADTQVMPVARTARLWVRTEDQVLANAPAFVRVVNTAAAGAPSNIGQFRSDADGGDALLVPGARYRRVSGLIAELEVNFRE